MLQPKQSLHQLLWLIMTSLVKCVRLAVGWKLPSESLRGLSLGATDLEGKSEAVEQGDGALHRGEAEDLAVP